MSRFDVPYADCTFPRTHPDHLSALGRLRGIETADPEHCTVLELGCASGWNIIAMAAHLPHSRFVGVDIDAKAIERGRELIDKLRAMPMLQDAGIGLQNIELRVGDATLPAGADERFDYVIAHGLYSWVPAELRSRILDTLAAALAPQGVGYVSYNTLPGWSVYEQIRHLLIAVTEGAPTPEAAPAAAVELLTTLTQTPPLGQVEIVAPAIRQAAEQVRRAIQWRPDYLFHEYLADHNHPIWYGRFEREAEAAQLTVFGDADITTWQLPPALHDVPSSTLRQILVDALRGQTLRRSLLVHSDVSLTHTVGAEQLAGLVLSHSFDVAPDGAFVRAPGTPNEMRVEVPPDSCMHRLLSALCSTHGLPFEQLVEQLEETPDTLDKAAAPLVAQGLITVRGRQLPTIPTPPSLPKVDPFIRACCALGIEAAAGHRHVPLFPDSMTIPLLHLCNGTRRHDQLIEILTATALGSLHADADPEVVAEQVKREVPLMLERFAQLGCFVS